MSSAPSASTRSNLGLFQSDATRPSFASLVTAAISQAPADGLASTDVYEDSDEWLSVDARDFENMLETTMGSSSKQQQQQNIMEVDGDEEQSAEDRVASEQASRLKNLATKVEAFVEGKGDLEGATFDE